MIVRRPRADELDNIIIVMEYYRDEANLPDGEYDPDAMLNSVRSFMIQADHIWFNLYEGQRIVGIIGGYLTQLPWSRKIQAHVQFIYVLPSHRNLTNAKSLFEEFEKWAKNCGAERITAGDIGIDTERTQAFYQHLGFSAVGCNMKKDLNNE